MVRRARENDDDISLFPFLSIIASVIGVLTMLIATITLSQTRASNVADDLEKIESYEANQKKLVEVEGRIKALREKISVSKSSALRLQEDKQELQATKDELEKLFAELERVRKEIEEQQKIQVVIPKLDPADRESVVEMQSELAAIREQVAQLEKDLKDRKDVPSEGNVTVLPQGSGLNFVPHFVECADGSIVLHTTKQPKRIRLGEVVKDQQFLDLLTLVANGANDSIVFLVRSDGLQSYRYCRDLCRKREIRNGKIPVVGQGRIDLSVFNKKSGR